ncbi:hypothetical protein GCM10020331_052060 [Ectobacillus funiculus]
MSDAYRSREERKQLEQRIISGTYQSREERKQIERSQQTQPGTKKSPPKKDLS